MLYTIVDPCQIFQVQTMKLEAGVEVLAEASETQPVLAILHTLWKVTSKVYIIQHSPFLMKPSQYCNTKLIIGT